MLHQAFLLGIAFLKMYFAEMKTYYAVFVSNSHNQR